MPSANRVSKESLVKELHQGFQATQAAVVAHYAGVTVEKMTGLRKEIRLKKGKLQVLKNTLMTRATQGTSLEDLKDVFKGPTALATTENDPVALAKVLTEFAAGEQKLVIRAGILNGKLLTKEQVEELAKIPAREVLLARLAGALQSPYAGFVYTLSGVLRKLVYALDAVRREKEEKGK